MRHNMEHPHARPMEPLEFGDKAVSFDDYAEMPLHFATQHGVFCIEFYV